MRPRLWAALGALALALLLLAPALAPLPSSMDAFSDDLANGTFRPFGPAFSKAQARSFSGNLGGFTGSSTGNYLPGAAEVPTQWLMDRDGRGGNVVIDYVFNPSLGAMKRLKAYDAVSEDGTTLEVADKTLRPLSPDPRLQYDRPFQGSFQVQFKKGEPVPIFSVHPRAIVSSYRTEPALAGGVSFFRDGADTIYARAAEDKTVLLNLTYLAASDYYVFDPPEGVRATDYALSVRPRVAPALAEDARVVLARAGAGDGSDIGASLRALNDYFRAFTEGEIPEPAEVESLYLALALSGHGCCRHRAFAYMVTAQSIGVPTRVVVNEAHAFVEVMMPDGRWHQVNLGGCGTYTVNNPRNLPSLLDAADSPREEANPDENRPVPRVVTFTNITESPLRIVKGERYFVNGTVQDANGRGVAGAQIDVYLNATKDTPGRLTGAGRTGPDGRFSIESRVPGEVAANSYQLVARSADTAAGALRYAESWSDPPVDVFSPTRFILPRYAAAKDIPVNLSGILVDIDGEPVGNARISWSVEGAARPDIATDALGRFTAQATFATLGERPVEFRFNGNQHHGVSAGTATVRVDRGALILPPEAPTLARGATGSLTGTVAVGGVDLAGRAVQVTLLAANGTARVLAQVQATTDGLGAFAARVPIAAGTPPGFYPVTYDVPSLALNATGLARIAARPTLAVEAPEDVTPTEEWIITAQLLSDNGTGIVGGIVEMTLDGNASTTRALLTNRTGHARFVVAPGLADGAHRVRLAFPGDAQHATAQAVHTVQVSPPLYATIPAWAYALLVGALALLALLAWLARPAGPLHAALQRRLGPAGLGGRRRARLVFPEHPDGVPPVLEPGGRLVARILVADREGAPRSQAVLLLANGKRHRTRAGADVPLDAPAARLLRLEARGRGIARWWTRPAHVDVPVVSYRQAVEAGFVALRDQARLDAATTPGELVRALAASLDDESATRLRQAARLFEVADYSEAPVDRAFYHAFARARLDVERRLQEGASDG